MYEGLWATLSFLHSPLSLLPHLSPPPNASRAGTCWTPSFCRTGRHTPCRSSTASRCLPLVLPVSHLLSFFRLIKVVLHPSLGLRVLLPSEATFSDRFSLQLWETALATPQPMAMRQNMAPKGGRSGDGKQQCLGTAPQPHLPTPLPYITPSSVRGQRTWAQADETGTQLLSRRAGLR